MPTEESAGAIIFTYQRAARKFRRGRGKKGKRKREYLLLRYPNHWDFPRGHLEGEETVGEAAKREIKEETGLTVKRLIPGFEEHLTLSMWSHKDVHRKKKGGKRQRITKHVTLFLAHASSRKVTVSFEHDGYVWLPYKEAMEHVTYKNAREALKKAEYFLRRQKQRKH